MSSPLFARKKNMRFIEKSKTNNWSLNIGHVDRQILSSKTSLDNKCQGNIGCVVALVKLISQ